MRAMTPAVRATTPAVRVATPVVRHSARASKRTARLVEEAQEKAQPDELAELRVQNELLRQQLRHSRSSSVTSETPPAVAADEPAVDGVHSPPAEALSFTMQAPQQVSFTAPQLPATPNTQELLASMLQQMTAAQMTPTGEHQAVTPFLVLGSTLEPKIRAKTWEGAYVELGALASSEPAVAVAVSNTGQQPSISLTTVRARPPGNILEWLRRFATYAAVYLERQATEAPSVLTYMVSIVDMHRRHGAFAWCVYDEKFRRVRVRWCRLCHGTRQIGSWQWMLSTARPAHPSAATLTSSSSNPFGTCVDPTPPAYASPSTAPASAPAPPAASHTCAQAAAGRAIRASRAVWQRAGSRAGPTPRLPTPVHAHRRHHFLSAYTPRLRDTLVQGFTFGFHIPSTKSIQSDHFIYVNNHASSLANSAFTTVKLEHEVAMGRIEGPFLTPTPNVVLSPLGIAPKKVPGEFRLIHDLSFPKGDSVNSHIDRSFMEVHYELLDHCISIIRSLGPNCQIAKADIKDAFRIIPIHPNDHKLLVFSCQGKFNYDKCLPMGCSISCQTFELFANALQWILMSKLHVQFMSHILDDFIFFSPPDSRQSHAGLQAFLSLAHSLNIPLRHDKTVFPTTIISLHGIEVDTASMQMRLPLDKWHDARNKIDTMY